MSKTKTFGTFTLKKKTDKIAGEISIKVEILNYATTVVKNSITDVIRYQEEDNISNKGYVIQNTDNDGNIKEQVCLNQLEFVSLYTSMSLYMKDIVCKPLSEIQKTISPNEPFKFNTSKKVIENNKNQNKK